MPDSVRSSSSSLSDILIDVDSPDPESSTTTNPNPPLRFSNAFAALGSIPSRKRALVYIEVEKDPKRPRTSAIWDYGREVQLENTTNSQRCWECNLCRTRLTARATTNAITHLRKVHKIKINSQALSSFTPTVIDQQIQGVEQQLHNSPILQNLSIQERLVRFVTICHIPYNAIVSPYF
jgi:BED zinc finger